MRKKLNRKLKFALAGFGAFALAGVSCVGLASLENQDAIASYAIESPTDGNPVENGLFTFTLSDGHYYVNVPSLSIQLPDSISSVSSFRLWFTDSTYEHGVVYTDSWGLTNRGSFVDGVLTLDCDVEVSITEDGFSGVSNYWLIYLNSWSYELRSDSVDYSSFNCSGDTSPYTLTPVIPHAPTSVDFVHDIVDILTAGIVNLGQGIGQGVSSFVQSLAFNSAGDGLSVYFVLVCVFGGIALAVALTSKVFMWLNGLGA